MTSYLGRTRSTTFSSSRYHQEHPPPPSDLCVSSFVASPVRRASSETNLSILHHKDVVSSLERMSHAAHGHRELEHMSHAAHSPRDPSSLERMSHAAYAPRDISHGAQGPRELKKLSEKGSLLFAAETASTHGHTAGGDGDGGGGGGGEGTGAVPAAPITLSTATEKPHLNLEFDACIQEHPNTAVSPKMVDCLSVSYRYTKLVAYYIFVILVGVPLTFVWGCTNGLAVFCCVWVWGPQLKLILLCVHSCAPVIVTPFQVICSPIVDVFARILRQIRLQAIVLGQASLDRYSATGPVHAA